MGRDAGCDGGGCRVNGDCVGGTIGVCVLSDHLGKEEFRCEAAGQRRADETTIDVSHVQVRRCFGAADLL